MSSRVSVEFRRQRLLAWGGAVMAASLVMVTAVAFERASAARHEGEARVALTYELASLRARLEAELLSRIYINQALVGHVALHPDISTVEFEALAQAMSAWSPGVRSVQLARDSVISHLYPLAGNEQAQGLRLLDIPAQRAAVRRAIESGRTVVAGPVKLVQGGEAFVSRTPIYLPAEEGGRYWGLSMVVVDAAALYRAAGLLEAQARMRLALRGRDASGTGGEPFWGEASLFAATPVTLDVAVPGGGWQLAALPRGGWARDHHESGLWLGGGLLLALTVGGLIFNLVAAPARLRVAVRDATRRLRRARAGLEGEVERRTAELEEAVTNLQAAKRGAESANRAKSEFLAAVSHELRTPMNGLLGNLELLRGTGLSSDQHDLLDLVSDAGDTLLTLLNEISEHAGVSDGVVRVERRGFSLRALLAGSIDLLKQRAAAKGLTLALTVHETVWSHLEGDPLLLRKVLVNLLGNAVKFTARGGVRLEVEVVAEREGEQLLRFHVIDSGRVIPAAERQRLFAPFEQGRAVGPGHGGTGLGLAACTRLVEAMGGTLGLDVAAEGGNDFWVRLPFGRGLSPEGAEDEPQRAALRILVAEDLEINRRVMEGFLGRMGHEVRFAADGEEAVALVASERFDLVFMDLRMPRLDGIGATHQIRDTDGALPIIAVTANLIADELEELVAADFTGILVKPLTPPQLRREIERVVTPRGVLLRGISLAQYRADLGREAADGLYRTFVTTTPETLAAYREAQAAGRLGEAGSRAHRLAGAAASLGLLAVADAARAAERAALAGEAGGEEMARLIEAHALTLECLRRELG